VRKVEGSPVRSLVWGRWRRSESKTLQSDLPKKRLPADVSAMTMQGSMGKVNSRGETGAKTTRPEYMQGVGEMFD